MKNLSVLVVDDSAIYRKIVGRGVESIPNVDLLGFAADGVEALEKVQELRPDLLLLDIEMPRMDGLQTIQELRRKGNKTGVIVVSSVDVRACSKTLSAVQAGAFEMVAKPGVSAGGNAREQLTRDISRAIEAFRFSRSARAMRPAPMRSPGPTAPTPTAPTMPVAPSRRSDPFEVLVLGISTGGPAALSKVIPKLSARFPIPILVVQHMPAGFTKHLADTLNNNSKIQVVEGVHGMKVKPGQVVIAPGGHHMSISGSRIAPQVTLDEGPMVNGARPAVDRLFESAAKMYSHRTLGVIMTGMGTDGLQGCRTIKGAGGFCVSQDQASSVVYGMPKAVAEAGLSDEVVSMADMDNRLQMLASRVAR